MKRCFLLSLLAILLTLPAQGQSTLDTLKTEAVRSRGFIRAAETQLSKVLDLLERLELTPPDTTSPDPGPDPDPDPDDPDPDDPDPDPGPDPDPDPGPSGPYGPNNPYVLDVQHGDDIGALIYSIADTTRDVYIQLPNRPMTLTLNEVLNLSCSGDHQVRNFHLLSSKARVMIRVPEERHGKRIRIGRDHNCTESIAEDVLLGSPVNRGGMDNYNLIFDGSSVGPVQGNPNGKGDGGILRVWSNPGQTKVVSRAVFQNAWQRGLMIHGAGDVTIAGRHYNAAVYLSGVRDIVLEDSVYYADPYGKGWGWTGLYNSGDQATTDYYGDRYGSGRGEEGYGSHQMGFVIVTARSLKGTLLQEFGGNSWFWSMVPRIGQSSEEPFHMIGKNIGWMHTGHMLEHPQIGTEWGKTDPISRYSEDVQGQVWIKFEHIIDFGDWRFGGPAGGGSWNPGPNFEATNDGCAGRNDWSNSNMEVTYVNIRGNSNTSRLACVDENDQPYAKSRNNIFQGDGVSRSIGPGVLLLGEQNEVRNGTFGDIRPDPHFVWYARRQDSSTPCGWSTCNPCSDNYIHDIALTGKIEIPRSCTNTRIERVRGSSDRQIVAQEPFRCGNTTMQPGTYSFSQIGRLVGSNFEVCGTN